MRVLSSIVTSDMNDIKVDSPEMQQMALRQPLSKILAQGGIDSESEVALNLDKALRRIKKNNEKI